MSVSGTEHNLTRTRFRHGLYNEAALEQEIAEAKIGLLTTNLQTVPPVTTRIKRK